MYSRKFFQIYSPWAEVASKNKLTWSYLKDELAITTQTRKLIEGVNRKLLQLKLSNVFKLQQDEWRYVYNEQHESKELPR